MTDDSFHMPICIGIGIGISVGKIFSSVLGIKSIGKKWYRSTFNPNTTCQWVIQVNAFDPVLMRVAKYKAFVFGQLYKFGFC